MITATVAALTKLAGTGLGIIDQFVEDKDLKQKLAIRQLELTYGMVEKIINATTVPWVDALVKLLMASMVLARPIGSFAMTCAGIYFHYKGIQIDSTVHAAMDMAFPAWGGAREIHKGREEKTKQKTLEYGGISKWE